MAIKRYFPFLIVLLMPVLTAGQQSDVKTDPKQDRQNRLVREVVAEIPNFRLGENRSFVYARAGRIVCKSDPKLSGELFRNAIRELVGTQISAEGEPKSQNRQFDMMRAQMSRQNVLMAIAPCDGAFALESFYKTRPAAIEKALATPVETTGKNGVISTSYSQLAQTEINFEQTLIGFAAKQDPTMAVDLLKASIKKGLSVATLGLLKSLYAKDPAAANEMAAEVVGRVQSNLFSSGQQPQAANLATAILMEFTRVKKPDEKSTLKFDPAQMRSLLDRLVSYYTDNTSRSGVMSYRSLIAIADKLSPFAARQLRALEQAGRQRSPGRTSDTEAGRLMARNAPPEALAAQAAKLNENSRPEVYRATANKLTAAGEYERALTLLHSNLADDALESAIGSLNWYYAHLLLNQAKFAEAERVIDAMPDGNRQSGLIDLAKALFAKDAVNNKEYAGSLLSKARVQMPQRPDNTREMSALMQLVNAYMTIEPNEALRVMEPVMPQLNDLAGSAIVLLGFQGNPNIRQGEFVISNNMTAGFQFDWSIFNALAKKDFESTLGLVDSLSQREIRVFVKLQLAEMR
jgi:hypothetical protein